MPPSRRRLLAAAVAASVPLAGCSRTVSESERPTTPTEAAESDSGVGGSTGEFEYAYLRGNDDRAVAWLPDEERSTTEVRRRPGRLVVDERERADGLQYADVDGADEAAAFVAAADFDAETVYVDQQRVDDCYRLDLCDVEWTTRGFSFSYGRVGLPYDVRCEADADVVEARFVKVPEPLDREELRSVESGIRSKPCRGDRSPTAGSDVPGTDDAGTDGTGTDDAGTTATGNEGAERTGPNESERVESGRDGSRRVGSSRVVADREVER